ncbi:hypothetical protein MHBO_002986 [Bonamia ostreae]|uniref:Uncharacterized protein n=1 Tax=Bonamia ostreae TaxID=126728 RepID=A0ABV2AP45_9EUKA
MYPDNIIGGNSSIKTHRKGTTTCLIYRKKGKSHQSVLRVWGSSEMLTKLPAESHES